LYPTPEEKQAALEAVLASETFVRTEQLRALLRFVCEREMAGQASELTEYLIGTKALGRPEDFSPLEDSSVRTRAYELRQRLQRYYTNENPGAMVRIELPKGTRDGWVGFWRGALWRRWPPGRSSVESRAPALNRLLSGPGIP
jgi:hypothetical protein